MLKQVLGIVTSLLTLWGMKLAGDKKSKGWLVGLLNQAVWLVFIIVFQAWTLLILNVSLVWVYSRNLIRWRREERSAEEGSA